jgi:uncharacterized membrane protein HdeD (DUF308 family)
MSAGHTGPKDTDETARPPDSGGGMLSRSLGWQAPLSVGLITVVLGIIIAVLPTQSLNVIAILLGILMIVSGIFHLISVFGSGEHERFWYGIAGLLFIITGVILIRHLRLSVAVVGLVIGFTWIVQGVSLLLAGSSGRPRTGSGWSAFFGVISLIAGIVVVAAPVASVTALAVLTGIWFIVMGLLETFAALLLRRAIRKEQDNVSVPGQRPAEAEAGRGTSRASSRHGVTG